MQIGGGLFSYKYIHPQVKHKATWCQWPNGTQHGPHRSDATKGEKEYLLKLEPHLSNHSFHWGNVKSNINISTNMKTHLTVSPLSSSLAPPCGNHVSLSSSSSFWLSITQRLIGTELTENIQQMVCCCLCGRPLAGHPAAPPFPPRPAAYPCNSRSFPHTYLPTNTQHPPASLHPIQVTCCQAYNS